VTWVIGLIVIGYGVTGATNTLLYLYTPEIYPTRIRAIATSVATAWLRLSSAIAPAIVGVFIGRGGIGLMFLVFAAAAILGALAAGYMIETRERRLEDIAS
jgi:putative MFS transporter